MFSKARLEALSDGLFAIVLTLLVLELKTPVGVPPDRLGAELLKDLPAWFSFAFTFFLGSIFWVDQHKVLQTLSEVSRGSLILNLVFLAFVTVLPFSTSVWGHYLRQPLALKIYFGNEFAIALALTAQIELAVRRKEIKPGADPHPIRFRLISMCLIMASAVIAASYLNVEYYALAPFTLIVVLKVIKRRWMKKRTLRAAAALR